jgi:hypothetical protein
MRRAYTERGPKRILNARIQAADVTHYAGSTAFGDRRLQFRKNESESRTCVHRICTRPPSNYLISINSLPNPSWDSLPDLICRPPNGRIYPRETAPATAPASHQKRPRKSTTNAIEIERKRRKINEADRCSALIAVWSKVRVLSEPTTKSIAIRALLTAAVDSRLKYRGGAFIVREAACIAPTPKNLTMKNLGQLLSLSFAVARNRTMSS